ncbi:protein hinderin isoform X2 [Tyto alba]|uniref:protein hinderin isoform X2 n=1 Tax=Tyto alba TaxID=56313 RepID=UPI0014025B24|nr:protein hinderin isoform X2 [Tyto alba]XP_032867005.1 protein hinderin isoform X2 [Tyto alba]
MIFQGMMLFLTTISTVHVFARVSMRGKLRTRYLPKYQKSKTELKVPVAVASVSMDPVRSTGDLTGQQVTNEGGMKSASLKDLCPEDKRRIANLIKELARVSEEKEVTEERLKAEQESFEKKIRQLEEQNELIIKEREALQQQYRECQELLSLYQKYLAEQQEKLSLSLSELSAAKEKEQKGPHSDQRNGLVLNLHVPPSVSTPPKEIPDLKIQVSSKKSSCQQPSLEIDGSYLGIGGPQTFYKNSRASKAGSPAHVALSQPCRNNHDYMTEIHYNHQDSLKKYLIENGLHRKCNNMISPAKQRNPHHVKPAQEMDQKANEFQSTCPQQVSHSCDCKHAENSGSRQESHHVSQVLRRHSGPVHETCDYSRCSQISGVNDNMDLGPKETEQAKRYEERRQKLLLQKTELEIEKERLQHLLAKQEAKLLLKQKQLQQSCLDYYRFRGHIPGSEDVPIDEAPGELALMMNSNSMGLSVPVLKYEDYFPRTPPVNKTSRTPRSSGGSSSGKKMVGFGANVKDGQTLLMQTKREGTKSKKGTTSGPRKDAATSPVLIGNSKELATTATSPVQHYTSRYEACLPDLVEVMSLVSAPGHLCRESYDRNKMHTPCRMSHRLPSWYQTPCSSRSRADELEESQLLEEIFFV